MKSIRNSFYSNLTFDNLLYSYNKTKVGKSYVLEVLDFNYNLEINIINLINKIKIINNEINIFFILENKNDELEKIL